MQLQARSRLNDVASHAAHLLGVILLFGLAGIAGIVLGRWLMDSLKSTNSLPFTSIPIEWVSGTIGMGAVLAFVGELKDALYSLLEQAKAPATLAALQVALRLAFSVFVFTVTVLSVQKILEDKPVAAPIVNLDGVALLESRNTQPIATLPILHKSNAKGLTKEADGIRLEPDQIARLQAFIDALDQNCRDLEYGRPIAMKVLGFASSKEFPTATDRSNTVVANLRGQTVKQQLDAQMQLNDRANYFKVVPHSWADYDDMIQQRPVFDRIQRAPDTDAEYLNRRVDIQLIATGRCDAMQAVRVLLGRS